MRHVAAALLVLGACGGSSSAPDDAATTGDAAATTGDAPPTAGCGTPGATGTINGSIPVGGTDRTYILVVPSGYDGSRAFPLIFAWHGRTGTAANARQYFGIEGVTAGAAIIVYPQGLPVSADPNDTGWELTADGRDIAFYDALSAHLRDTYCIGSSYSMGHSFGGYMSNSVGCYRGGTSPGSVRAIAPVAGGGPFGSCPGDPIAAVIMHGMNDMVVPFAQGEGSRDAWLARSGCASTSAPITPSPCIAYDSCPSSHQIRFCAHSDTTFSGHGWPSWAPQAAWDLFTATP